MGAALTPTPPASLAPGDTIRCPGGEAVVEDVHAEGALVRVQFRDRTGRAFVYLRRTTPVIVLAPGSCAGPAPVV